MAEECQRTFETIFPEHRAILAWAELFSKARNGVHASLCAGREWSDVSVEDWRDSGLSAKQFEHAGKAAIAARDAAVEGAAARVSTLKLKIKAQEKKLDGKAKEEARLTAAIAKADGKRRKAHAKIRSAKKEMSPPSPSASSSPSLPPSPSPPAPKRPKPAKAAKLAVSIQAARAAAKEADAIVAKASQERGKIRSALHQGRRRLGNLNHQLAWAVGQSESDASSLCFGTKKLLRGRSDPKSQGFEDAAAWRTEWERVRTRNLLVEGAARAEGGNEFVRATIAGDQTISLEIRLPPGLGALAEEKIRVSGHELRVVRVHGLHFNHGHEAVLEAVRAANGARADRGASSAASEAAGSRPIAWRFREMEDGRGWRVHASIHQAMPENASDPGKGRMAVDLNEHCVACALASPTGDLVRSWTIPLCLYGLSEGQRLAKIRDVCASLAKTAFDLGVPLSWEKLDFSAKKSSLTERDGPKRARMLSSFAYSAFDAALESACARLGVQRSRVNPAYTSVAGRILHAQRRGIPVHEAAAFCIARRAMKLSEGAPRPAGLTLPDGARVTLVPLAKTGRRHVWASWSKISQGMKAVLAAHARAERSERARRRERFKGSGFPAPSDGVVALVRGKVRFLPEAGPEAGPAADPLRVGFGPSCGLHLSTR